MSRIKSNFDYLFVIIYFTGTIFFQTKLSENVLLNIHGNTKFWDTYFEIIYYGIFAVACLLFYKNKIAASIKKNKNYRFQIYRYCTYIYYHYNGRFRHYIVI